MTELEADAAYLDLLSQITSKSPQNVELGQFYGAVTTGELKTVKHWIEVAHILGTEESRTPIQVHSLSLAVAAAIVAGDKDMISYLIEQKADINCSAVVDATPATFDQLLKYYPQSDRPGKIQSTFNECGHNLKLAEHLIILGAEGSLETDQAEPENVTAMTDAEMDQMLNFMHTPPPTNES